MEVHILQKYNKLCCERQGEFELAGRKVNVEIKPDKLKDPFGARLWLRMLKHTLAGLSVHFFNKPFPTIL